MLWTAKGPGFSGDYQVLLSLMEELVQAFVADAIWHPGIALTWILPFIPVTRLG